MHATGRGPFSLGSPIAGSEVFVGCTVMDVLQFFAPATTIALSDAVGATAFTLPIWVRIASTSAILNAGGLALPSLAPKRCPGITISRLLPKAEIWSETDFVAPLPSVTMVMTADTPITMPRMVKNDRITLRLISFNATSSVLAPPQARKLALDLDGHCSSPLPAFAVSSPSRP
jgi:hypothetical protein